jgi:hypothetical protein
MLAGLVHTRGPLAPARAAARPAGPAPGLAGPEDHRGDLVPGPDRTRLAVRAADFPPPWRTVYGYFAAWRDNGTLARLHDQLRA